MAQIKEIKKEDQKLAIAAEILAGLVFQIVLKPILRRLGNFVSGELMRGMIRLVLLVCPIPVKTVQRLTA